MTSDHFFGKERKLIEDYLYAIEKKPPFYDQLIEHEIATHTFPSAAKTMPDLWELINHMGKYAPSDIKLDHVLSLDDEKISKGMDHDSYLSAYKESDLRQLMATCYCDMVENLPGAKEYTEAEVKIEQLELDHPGITHKEQIFFNFCLSAPGRALWESILVAREDEIMEDFLSTMQEPKFVYQLCKIALQHLSHNPRDLLIKEQAVTEDEAELRLTQEILHRWSREERDKLIKAADTRRRRPDTQKTKDTPTVSTKETILEMWLPRALWKKDTAGILDALPELATGSAGDDHERDCNKIGKAIRELGLSTRM